MLQNVVGNGCHEPPVVQGTKTQPGMPRRVSCEAGATGVDSLVAVDKGRESAFSQCDRTAFLLGGIHLRIFVGVTTDEKRACLP